VNPATSRSASSARPSLRVERQLLKSGARLLASIDEVGRGALSGPVTVGVVLVDASVRTAPSGVRDSKLLSPRARVDLVPRIRSWSVGWAVGHASAQEIDEVGIIGALRMAGRRALAQLTLSPDAILLDGSHDWLSSPDQPSLFAPDTDPLSAPVTMKVKADLTCASVAAASVLAKTERDGLMIALASEYPHYGWHENKGYASPEHLAAIREFGTCDQHRRSWRLPDQESSTGLPEVAMDPQDRELRRYRD
jgi:ribonuclease HII